MTFYISIYIMNHLQFMCWIFYELAHIFPSDGYICMTWNFTGEKLQLKCLTNQTRSKISIIDPFNQEQGYCSIPYPFPACISHYRNGNIHQTLAGKETIFDLRGLIDESVNGKWSCHHGTNVETAFADISILDKKESIVHIRLTAPPLIKTSKSVWLKCVSNIPMNIKLVRFYVNNKLYNTLTKLDSGCHSSVRCRPNACQCSADGKTYLIKHGGFKSGGIFSLECKVEFHTSLEMSDCMMIKVTESPILEATSTAVCSPSTDIKLSCNASGELPFLHFRLWQHSYNGNVIRYLEGKRTANSSILHLDQCNYEDEGDYICSAWIRLDNVVLSDNVSSKVVIKGLPMITDKYIHVYKEPLMTLSVNIYAEPHPINVSWFIENVQMKNTTSHMIAFSKTLVERKLHGKLIRTIGFSANLTLKNILNVQKTFCILVQNEIGNASEQFVIVEKVSVSDSEFYLKDILWFVSGTIIVILVSSVFASLFNKYRGVGRETTYSDTTYNAEQSEGSNVHLYNIPETIANYVEIGSIQNDEHIADQPNEYEEIDKNESEEGYQIVHEYMEVF